MQPRMSRKHNICNSKILFIIPSLIIVMLLFVVPIFYSLWLSFHTGELKNLYFFGIGNYNRMINDRTYQITLLNSIEFVLLIVPTIIVISILATISLHSIHSERLKNIISSIFYIKGNLKIINPRWSIKRLKPTLNMLKKLYHIIYHSFAS